ncbi:MAG: C4-dicarboxylate ABC transporter permease, partial [Pseudomonadota bacterium]|nr:C4-dicarboxylate ABC transporter permease [Pseudomonadota bacterium]
GISAMGSGVGYADGTSDFGDVLNEARMILRSRQLKDEEAVAEIDKSIAALDADLAWRRKGAEEILPQLETFDDTVAANIGVRAQNRLPTDMALDVAGCLSGHRDISLSF